MLIWLKSWAHPPRRELSASPGSQARHRAKKKTTRLFLFFSTHYFPWHGVGHVIRIKTLSVSVLFYYTQKTTAKLTSKWRYFVLLLRYHPSAFSRCWLCCVCYCCIPVMDEKEIVQSQQKRCLLHNDVKHLHQPAFLRHLPFHTMSVWSHGILQKRNLLIKIVSF